MKTPQFIPLALLFTCGVVFTLCLVLARELATAGMPPLGCVFWQAVGGVLLFAALSWKQKVYPHFSLDHLKHHVGMSIAYILVPNAILFFGASKVATGYLSIVTTLTPVMTYLLAIAFKIDTPARWKVVGIITGVSGALVLLSPGVNFGQSASLLWSIVVVLIPLSYAISNIWRQAYWPEGQTAFSLALAMMLVSVPLVAILGWVSGSLFLPALTERASLYLLLLIVVYNTYVALAFHIVRVAGAVFLSQMGYVVALTGSTLGILLYGEVPNVYVLAGGLLILAGLGMVTLAGNQNE